LPLLHLLNETRRRAGVALFIAAGLLWLYLSFFPAFVASLEEHSTDWIWRQIAQTHTERRVIIVDIDEASLAQLGPWPWPRQRMAQLSERLAEEGSSLQVFDIFFPNPDPSDATLVNALAKNQAVIAQVLAIQGGSTRRGKLAGALPWTACPNIFPTAQHYLANAPGFSQLPVGHITPLVGQDGGIRLQPAVICESGTPYPALFLAAAQHASAQDTLQLTAGSWPLGPTWELHGLPFANRGIGLDPRGNVRIPWWQHPDSFISIPAHDLLERRVPAKLLENAWVIVGSSALGVNDWIASPFGRPEAGVMVHAQLLIGAMEGRIPAPPQAAWLLETLLALCSALLLYTIALRQRNPVIWLMGGALVGSSIFFGLKAGALTQFSLWFNWVPAAMLLCTFALLLSILEYAWSRRERDRIYSHLSSYLPRPVAAALAGRDPSSAIEATRSEVVAMYADIRNFSAYCETRPPTETTAVLHAFISLATEIVERHGGIIESIQGDAILAVWQARNDHSNSTLDNVATQALEAAVALVKASREILPDPESEILEPLVLGIGLESGPATIGSFGLARRRTHLVMGRTISVAVRLEQMTVELAHPLLIGENLAAYLAAHQLESQGVFLLDGIIAPCHIYAYPLKNCVA
jgi:adenylate cyclase